MRSTRARGSATEILTPEMEVVASQLKYLKYLNERIKEEEMRLAAAREAIPKLQNLLTQRQEDIKSFSGVLIDLIWLQTQSEESSEHDCENPFLLPALTAPLGCGRLTRLAAEAKEYRRNLSDSLDIVEKQIDTAQSVISTIGGELVRMQSIRSSMLESIRLQYALIHPIHRLCNDTLAYIFLLIVSEKFETVRMFRGHSDDCPALHAPIILASVCSTWRDIAYKSPSLWKRVVVTDISRPQPYWRNHAVPPIAVVAVGDTLFNGDHARLPSLESRTAINDLTITSKWLSRFQFDLFRVKSIQRLTVAYSEFQNYPTRFHVPAGLSSLSSLTCIHTYPVFDSSVPPIKDLSILVRSSDYQPQSSFDMILHHCPNLEALSLHCLPVLPVLGTEQQSLSTIKAHFSAIKSLSSALNHHTLVLPNLVRLEITDLGHESLLENWNEVFPFDSWPSQVTYLHIELRTKSPRFVAPDQLYRLLIPFVSIMTLSIANEPLLPVLLPAGVVPVARDLFRLRVERCSFDGKALLDVVRRRNESEWFARGDVSPLTQVELWDCPNVPPTTMRELRRLRGD